MSFPQWFAGQVITAERLNARNVHEVLQSQDQEASTTNYVMSEIQVEFEPDATYMYWCYISYTADYRNGLRWAWSGSGTTLGSFTQAMAHDASGATGQNASREVIFRRPANTTDRQAGGTSLLSGASPVSVVQTAYDQGTLITSGGTPTLNLMFGRWASGVGQNTILRGGNQTRFLYQRIA